MDVVVKFLEGGISKGSCKNQLDELMKYEDFLSPKWRYRITGCLNPQCGMKNWLTESDVMRLRPNGKAWSTWKPVTCRFDVLQLLKSLYRFIDSKSVESLLVLSSPLHFLLTHEKVGFQKRRLHSMPNWHKQLNLNQILILHLDVDYELETIAVFF